MVPDPRAQARPDSLRPLNAPLAINVTAEGQRPRSIVFNRQTRQVERIQDTWIIEDEWWRQPISRQYFALLLDDGTRRTVYHDRAADAWFLQDY
ncbi:MAG: hypothetical protein H0T72_09305 [Chloroflexia bacterium]|jgi:hypothetical protein|nr:hypothetical protein [Chloroflexia bacterium]